MCVNRETGELQVMPFSGGFLEQPSKTMDALQIIQERFCEKIFEEQERVKRG